MNDHITDLIPRGSIIDLVQQHDRAVEMCRKGRDMIYEAAQIIAHSIGRDVAHNRCDHLGDFRMENALQGMEANIKQTYWHHVIERSQIKRIMHAKQRDELDRQMEKPETMPPFTVEAVQTTLFGWAESSQDTVTQLITETFRYFVPRGWQLDKYKSNKSARIDRRLITMGLGGYHSFQRERLGDLERCFYVLDGKRPPEYPHDTPTKLLNAWRDRDQMETDYFNFKWFRNGNMHIIFMRPDLLSEFNRIGGEGLARIGDE